MTTDVFGIVGTKQAGVFRVERVVAEGGFAVVYRAMHEGFRSPVALECLKVPDVMTAEQRGMRRASCCSASRRPQVGAVGGAASR